MRTAHLVPVADSQVSLFNLDLRDTADDAIVARWLADTLEGAFARTQGPLAITVPGGSTPFPIIERLLREDMPWERLVVWPNDDRVVPEHHDASNTGKLRALFEPAGAQVAPLTVMEKIPHFALAWLGMGADGHIASLFPNTDPQVDEEKSVLRITPDPLPPEAPFDRITLTIPALLDSDDVVIVARGAQKRAVLNAAAAGKSDLPVARFLKAADEAGQAVTVFT